ncbi:hypothetical protein [Streptomyces sp. NPDC001985]|uniref:hypothetical protein n=1 Tax=Streptomyces sp. NPDC001985 TaxID=3154406 RepID=UPI0033233210
MTADLTRRSAAPYPGRTAVEYLLPVSGTAVRSPLVSGDTLYYVNAAHGHLTEERAGSRRVLLPSVPADAVVCALGPTLYVTVPEGGWGIGFTVRHGVASCPVGRVEGGLVRALARLAAFGDPSGHGRFAQLEVESAAMRLRLSLPVLGPGPPRLPDHVAPLVAHTLHMTHELLLRPGPDERGVMAVRELRPPLHIQADRRSVAS